MQQTSVKQGSFGQRLHNIYVRQGQFVHYGSNLSSFSNLGRRIFFKEVRGNLN